MQYFPLWRESHNSTFRSAKENEEMQRFPFAKLRISKRAFELTQCNMDPCSPSTKQADFLEAERLKLVRME